MNIIQQFVLRPPGPVTEALATGDPNCIFQFLLLINYFKIFLLQMFLLSEMNRRCIFGTD